VLFLLISAGLIVAGHKLERDAIRSAKWPVVIGQLEFCEVVDVPGFRIEDPGTWQLQVRYSYVVGGRTYHSTQYALGYGSRGGDDTKHRIIASRLKNTPQLAVHYDPAHPSNAVLSTEVQPYVTMLGYFMMVLTAISAFIWLATGR
jgi:hypothetical protein